MINFDVSSTLLSVCDVCLSNYAVKTQERLFLKMYKISNTWIAYILRPDENSSIPLPCQPFSSKRRVQTPLCVSLLYSSY